MKAPHKDHFDRTAKLARNLEPRDVYKWLVTKGYFPEPYVLPPCFFVTSHPPFGKVYFPNGRDGNGKERFKPKLSECVQVHFPKTDLTDRTFGIIDPEIHSDVARTISENWPAIIGHLFHKDNRVTSYSFPIPLDSKKPGHIGTLRSGRMIYEWIEMAENDLVAISYKFKYLVTTDIKNFYPSIYTHSIPWAIHGKRQIRKPGNRTNYEFFGNRLDKLFQNANDGCTNGVPIGPAVSDLVAEIVLAAVDRLLSKQIGDDVVAVRFKDDYRILARSEESGRSVIKALQSALKEYHLELNDAKSEFYSLPDGLFRRWVSQYHSANPQPKKNYSFKRFKEVYLSVVRIDRDNPGCGVIDRFLADIVNKKYKLRLTLSRKRVPQIMSLLLTLPSLRTKAFPKVLAIIESLLAAPLGIEHVDSITTHLDDYLLQLSKKEPESRYLIAWINDFLASNNLNVTSRRKVKYADPIVRAIHENSFPTFNACGDFKLFEGMKRAAKRISMLEHLDVFRPQ